MLADNLSLFQSEIGDLQDMKGFDPNQNLPLDQSIIKHSDTLTPKKSEDPFESDMQNVKRQGSMRETRDDTGSYTEDRMEPLEEHKGE